MYKAGKRFQRGKTKTQKSGVHEQRIGLGECGASVEGGIGERRCG